MIIPLPPPRTAVVRTGVAGLVTLGVVACLTSAAHPGGDVAARYATVHNALSGIGMTEVGALRDGMVAEGRPLRVSLDLAEGCTTIVAVGGPGVRDLDAALLDPLESRIARGASHTSDATIRACVPSSGTYTLALAAVHGDGQVLVSTWSGASPLTEWTGSGHGAATGRAVGTCDAPVPLAAGDYAGTTAHGESVHEPKACQSTGSPELVYKLPIAGRKKVTLAVETAGKFDSVLYVRKEACADVDAEVACNDDAGPSRGAPVDRRHSRVEQVFEEGTYFVFVDGFKGSTGAFKLHVDLEDVPPLSEVCSDAPQLVAGTPVSGTTEGAFDQASSSCGDGAHGPDTVYSLQIAQRSRVRVTLHSDDFTPVVHLRARCEDPHSLIACADSSENDHEAEYLGVLDAGSYAVFADSAQREASGKYNLQAETTSETGAGTRGDRCADAIPVSASEHEVAGDTFLARDDLTTQCGGAGAPDVFYRIDVPARARLTAHLTRGEESHVLALLRGCGPGKVELGCGKNLDRAVGPGSYYIAVDGDSPTAFGAFTFAWGTHETRAQEAACRAPQALQDGQPVNGTTFGAATDKFTPTCVSVDTAAGAGAPDAVYKLVVASRRRVRLKLRTPGWDGVLSVRKACVEGESPAVSAGEVECKADSSNNGEIDFDSVLEAGTYFVIVDGRTPSSAGPFTIELQQ